MRFTGNLSRVIMYCLGNIIDIVVLDDIVADHTGTETLLNNTCLFLQKTLKRDTFEVSNASAEFYVSSALYRVLRTYNDIYIIIMERTKRDIQRLFGRRQQSTRFWSKGLLDVVIPKDDCQVDSACAYVLLLWCFHHIFLGICFFKQAIKVNFATISQTICLLYDFTKEIS